MIRRFLMAVVGCYALVFLAGLWSYDLGAAHCFMAHWQLRKKLRGAV